jgi:hypothetical protein
VTFLERLPALRAATGPGMTGGGCGSVSPSALVRRLRSIGGRELDFKLVNLIPLGVGSPALRYREQLLQASAGGHRLWRVHAGIIPSFDRCSHAGSRLPVPIAARVSRSGWPRPRVVDRRRRLP